ncbi:LOW QUALITY PROTEIN: uncharacterized protein [Amphiura filiformis]|uniref:LOW QUALITY PROTEIN: uncharacterized protein n=1 Tax=Amphiura filiformis TaxID=82378 RepID=UPI003B21A850
MTTREVQALLVGLHKDERAVLTGEGRRSTVQESMGKNKGSKKMDSNGEEEKPTPSDIGVSKSKEKTKKKTEMESAKKTKSSHKKKRSKDDMPDHETPPAKKQKSRHKKKDKDEKHDETQAKKKKLQEMGKNKGSDKIKIDTSSEETPTKCTTSIIDEVIRKSKEKRKESVPPAKKTKSTEKQHKDTKSGEKPKAKKEKKKILSDIEDLEKPGTSAKKEKKKKKMLSDSEDHEKPGTSEKKEKKMILSGSEDDAKKRVSGKKKKGKRNMSKSDLFKQHQRDEELRDLQEAVRRSMADMKQQQKALRKLSRERFGVSSSESSDDYDTPDAHLTGDESDEVSNDEYVESAPHTPVFVGVEVETLSKRKPFIPTLDISTTDDEGDDEGDDAGEELVQKKKKKRTKKRGPNPPHPPDSDDDPEPGRAYPPDRFGWTRSVSSVKKEKFDGRSHRVQSLTPTPTLTVIRPIIALFYFLQFFSQRLFALITTWTNVNLRGADKKETTVEEIKAWFGIRVLMGLVRLPCTEHYWSSQPGFNNELVCRTMTKNRFDAISQHLACANPADDPDHIKEEKHRYLHMRAHPLYALQELWDSVVRRCQRKYNLKQHLAIDEAMIKYKGFKACVKKFFLPMKPIRSGFKIYAMAESNTGYMCNFLVHQYVEGGVKMKDITLQVAQPFLDRYHHIYTDKLYTSIPLAKELLAERTYLTGAIKTISKEWPVDLSGTIAKNPHGYEKIKKMPKTPRGTMYIRQNADLTAVLWKDSRVVSILSSAHDGFRDKRTDRVTRKVKEEGSKVAKEEDIPAPTQVIDYIKNMGGVDRADQLRAYYSCSRKSQKWWRKILYFLVDIARVNAWICFKHHYMQKAKESKTDEESDDLPTLVDYEDWIPPVRKVWRRRQKAQNIQPSQWHWQRA